MGGGASPRPSKPPWEDQTGQSINILFFVKKMKHVFEENIIIELKTEYKMACCQDLT